MFGIGLSRTGTTSLHLAFEILGFRSRHFLWDLKEIESLDAATDTPIARSYQSLDRDYPGSRFILTARDKQSWLASCAKKFARTPREGGRVWQLRMDLYGCVRFDAEKFSAAYDRHVEGVKEYFSGRSDQLLIMDICKGDGWEKLCPFLGVPVPDGAFPHRNESRAQ